MDRQIQRGLGYNKNKRHKKKTRIKQQAAAKIHAASAPDVPSVQSMASTVPCPPVKVHEAIPPHCCPLILSVRCLLLPPCEFSGMPALEGLCCCVTVSWRQYTFLFLACLWCGNNCCILHGVSNYQTFWHPFAAEKVPCGWTSYPQQDKLMAPVAAMRHTWNVPWDALSGSHLQVICPISPSRRVTGSAPSLCMAYR